MSSIIEIPLFEKVSQRSSRVGTVETLSGQRFRVRTFFVGPENLILCSVVYEVLSDTGEGCTFFIHAPFGAGKSHLAEGVFITWMARHPDAKGRFLTAAEFARQWLTAQNTQTLPEFTREMHNLDILVLDDIHEMVRQRGVQDQLVLVLDRLSERNARWLVTSALPLSVLTLQPKLLSRLRKAIAVPIQEPTDEARVAILRSGMNARRAKITIDGTETLAEMSAHAQLSVYEMLNIQQQLELSRKTNGEKTIGSAHVRAYFTKKAEENEITVPEIAKLAAKYFQLRLVDLRGKSRKATLVLVRNIIYYLARKLTRATFAEIGKYFGGRDHTTVIHGYNQVEELSRSDAQTRQALEYLQNELRPLPVPKK